MAVNAGTARVASAAGNFLRLENRWTGEVLQLRRIRDAKGQTALFIDGSLPPHREGPPLHVHLHQREEGTVMSGTVGAQIGSETITLSTGGKAVFDAGIPHKWWNAGDDVLQMNGRATPAGDLDRFLQAMFAVLNAGPQGKPSIFYLAHVIWRHRDTQRLAIPPRIIQLVLFPSIILIGHALGKYRGDDWPGSPSSCPGAPEN